MSQSFLLDLLPMLSVYLNCRELLQVLASGRLIFQPFKTDRRVLLTGLSTRLLLLGTCRIQATRRIVRCWRAWRQWRWLEAVVFEAVRFHTFPTRTTVNMPCLETHFGGCLRSLDRRWPCGPFSQSPWARTCCVQNAHRRVSRWLAGP